MYKYLTGDLFVEDFSVVLLSEEGSLLGTDSARGQMPVYIFASNGSCTQGYVSLEGPDQDLQFKPRDYQGKYFDNLLFKLISCYLPQRKRYWTNYIRLRFIIIA